jgi:hypothetical protein
MDMNSIIRVVEGNADKLAHRWLERLRKEEDLMVAYLSVPEEQMVEHIRRAYEEIGSSMDHPRHPAVVDLFHDVGRRRKRERVPLTEVIRAIQLARSVLWQYVMEQGVFDSTVNLYQAINLHRQFVQFFDWAVLYAVEAYEAEPAG